MSAKCSLGLAIRAEGPLLRLERCLDAMDRDTGSHLISESPNPDPAKLPGNGRNGARLPRCCRRSGRRGRPTRDVLARYPDAERLGSENSLVFLGLVNTHHHGWGVSNYQMGAADDYLELWLSEIWSRKPVDTFLDSMWADMRNIRCHHGATR